MTWLLPGLVIILSLVWLGITYLSSLAKAFGNSHYGHLGSQILGWSLGELLIVLPLFTVTVGVAVLIVSRFVEGERVKYLLAIFPMVVLILSFGLTTAMNTYNQRLRRAEDEARRELDQKILASYPRHYTYADGWSHSPVDVDLYLSINPESGCVYRVVVSGANSPEAIKIGKSDGSKIRFWLGPVHSEGGEMKRDDMSYYAKFLDTKKKSLVEHYEIEFARRDDTDCKSSNL